jgi:sugar-specific transcriptional regulator TrmB
VTEATELEKLGLTRNEAKTYVALLELGAATATPLTRRAGLHASKTYAALDGLLAKGLASYVVRDGKRVFRAEEPENLLEFLAEKKRRINEEEEKAKKIISRLANQRGAAKETDEVLTYKGAGGLKSLYKKIYSTLKRGETHYVFGAPRSANELIEEFLSEANRERVKKGIALEIIFNADAREFGAKRAKMRFTQVKYFKDAGFIAPTCFEVFGDYYAIYYVATSEIRAFVIRNTEIARSMRNFFNVIWNSNYVKE